MPWTYPLTSSTPVASVWRSPVDASYLLPLSGGSSASPASLPPRASEPSARRAKPLSAVQRKPLASSTSSTANQPPRHSARPRSSSHSTALPNPSTSKGKYVPQDGEPEAITFIDLLKDASRQVDHNSKKKQRVVARDKDKEREHSLGRIGMDNRIGLDTHELSAPPLTKTSSTSSISSTRAPEKKLSMAMSAYKPEPRGRALAKTASLGAPGVVLVSGKSTPTSLPSPNLNCDLKLAPAHRLPARASVISNVTARKASFPEPTSTDGDSAMQDVIDLVDTDTEWEKPMSGPILRADTTMYMELDDEDSDSGMDMSVFTLEPPPQIRVPVPKPKPQPPQSNTASRPPAPTQRTRTGPPPLGMRRAPQLQPSQYSSSQGAKGVTVPRFKPPLLANAGGVTNMSGRGTKPATMTSSRPAPRGSGSKVAVVEIAAHASEDADSSFDVSFDVDADALEEAMKVYD
jgi:hypothetical protein